MRKMFIKKKFSKNIFFLVMYDHSLNQNFTSGVR